MELGHTTLAGGCIYQARNSESPCSGVFIELSFQPFPTSQGSGWGWKFPPSSHWVFPVTSRILRPSGGHSLTHFFNMNSPECDLKGLLMNNKLLSKNSKGFRNSMPGTRWRPNMYFLLYYSTLTSPTLISVSLTWQDHWTSLGFPLPVLQSGTASKAGRWGSCRICLIISLRDSSPVLLLLQLSCLLVFLWREGSSLGS